MKYSSIILLIILMVSTSCNDEVANKYGNKPTALGRLNEIEVIADDELWENNTGDTLRYYFESAYPIMPTPEPMFDLRHFTPNDLLAEPLRRELRTYLVVADLSDDDSPTTAMIRKDMGEERFLDLKEKGYSSTLGKEKWARNQILIYVMGTGPENVQRAIRENFPSIAKRINQHDEDQLIASIYAVKRTNPGIETVVEDMLDVQMNVPGDYKLVVEDKDENIIWLRRDDKQGAIMNIMMQSVDYKTELQFDIDRIKGSFNNLSQQYVHTDTPGSIMIINDEELPVYDYTYSIDDHYTRELRGVWEMTDDFMAGPFVGYTLHHKSSQKIILIYAFVFAPGEDKRDLVQQLDYIVKSLKITSTSAE